MFFPYNNGAISNIDQQHRSAIWIKSIVLARLAEMKNP